MSDLADTIAREHRVALVDQNAGTTKCTCGEWTSSRASEGMLDVHGRHVAEVTEAQVRAQATRLEPWESIALTVASAQLYRGEEPGPNTAAVCIDALERIARGESS